MPLRRCYPLLSTARSTGKVTRDIIARLISGSNGLGQRLSKRNENNAVDVKIIDSDNSSEYARTDSGGYVLEPRDNSNVNVTLSSLIPQRAITVPFGDDHLDDRDVTLPSPLDKCTEDVSDVGPYLTPTFTFAKYANKSRTIQEMVKLGVKLHRLEPEEGMVQYILGLDFERDVKPYIMFLHDCGVPADYLGEFITKCPEILKEDIDDLRTRIRYLRAHEFDVDMIRIILRKNPNWLRFSTQDIDGRLGYFQSNFRLNGGQVRFLTLKGPKVITYKMLHLMQNTFAVKEEMGFDKGQTRKLLLRLPRIWIKNRERLLSVFEYVHDEMQLQRDFLVQEPHILLCRKTRLEQRHTFLMELKRAQYDPTKPMYVSPRALVSGTDVDFCRDIAKTSIDVYNAFLKTF